jgi:hypothetical protein
MCVVAVVAVVGVVSSINQRVSKILGVVAGVVFQFLGVVFQKAAA